MKGTHFVKTNENSRLILANDKYQVIWKVQFSDNCDREIQWSVVNVRHTSWIIDLHEN